MTYTYGPVSSWRYGRSLGVDVTTPPKKCTYNCIYCQLGPTKTQVTSPEEIQGAMPLSDEIISEVEETLSRLDRGTVDVLTFSGTGEPTLNPEIGSIVSRIRGTAQDLPIVLLTNASLLPSEAIRKGVLEFDIVTAKFDAGDEDTFKRINRPCKGAFKLHEIKDAIKKLGEEMKGMLALEVMLLRGPRGLTNVKGLPKRALIDDILDIIQTDQVLTAEILRAANSPFYGGLNEISTVKSAVVRLGNQEVVRLAVLVTEKCQYKVVNEQLRSYIEPLWRHTQGVAIGCQWLARKLGYRELENEAFIAGLIHDVGKLLLIKVMDQIMSSDDQIQQVAPTLVSELLDTAHTEYGHKLACLWELPEMYRSVIQEHHNASVDSNNTRLLLVRLANRACTKLGIGLQHDPSIVLTATEDAYDLGAKDLLLAELEIMLEDSKSLV